MRVPNKMGLTKYKVKSYATLDADLITSRAFASLNRTSMLVLIRFLQKRSWVTHKRRGGRGKPEYINTGLVFTYNEAKALGISESQFKRSIADLVRKGFISISHQGGSMSNGQDYSRYDLIQDWKAYGTQDFKPREKTKGARYGSGIAIYNEERKIKKNKGLMPSVSLSTVSDGPQSWSNVTALHKRNRS